MTLDANTPKTTPPIAPAKSSPPAVRPPMVAVPKPILPVAAPAPAKLK
jgi:hypothetical protein